MLHIYFMKNHYLCRRKLCKYTKNEAVRDGVIADEYPGDELRTLRQLLDTKTAIEVHSEFLAIFDITKIVIKSYAATQMTEANYQAVSISAVSDEDYEIYSNEY